MKQIKFYILVLLTVTFFSCKKVPFFATEGANIIISVDKSHLKTGGESARITIIGFGSDGEAIHDHTQVIFQATLGEIVPSQVEMMGGKAEVQFVSGTRSGIADIVARSGNIEATPNPLQVTIGSAALERLAISANPTNFSEGGGRSQIYVYAFDASNNLLSDIPVILTTTAGTFGYGSGIYLTDQQGKVEEFLNITQSALVKAECGEKTAEVEIRVEDSTENQDPTASFTFSPTSPARGETIYFNGSLSSDSDGYITGYQWDFGDGTRGSGQKPGHVYNWPDGEGNKTFNVVLQVTDNKGGSATTSQSVTVLEGGSNVSPTAQFSYSPPSPVANSPVYFNGNLSTDPDGYIVSWEWDFGDGNTGTGDHPSHTYTATGDYVVVLIVEDNQGARSNTSKTLTVSIP